MAGYGNFDLYAQLYGQNTADQMRQLWIAQNPLLAYNTGAIDASTYFKMTGKRAPGTGGGGNGGGGRSSSRKKTTPSSGNPVGDALGNALGTGLSYLGNYIGNQINNRVNRNGKY